MDADGQSANKFETALVHLRVLRKPPLQALAKTLHVKSSGNKDEIWTRILQHLKQREE